jgi:glyoxylase-like metal-dependent hydrolase (beta-lactamase superfamily II)
MEGRSWLLASAARPQRPPRASIGCWICIGVFTALRSEWGLALHLESQRGGETRRYLLDFGFTPEVYVNNLELLKIDPAAVDALILSHGHFDHMGGLIGFLEAQRPKHRRQNQGERVNRCSGKASPALGSRSRHGDRRACRGLHFATPDPRHNTAR